MNWKIVVLTILLGAIFAVLPVTADVVVFDNYVTNSYLISDGKIHIERELMLKNVGANPIIPGELHFKLHEIKKNKRIAPEITNFYAKNAYNTELKTRKIEGKEETDLVVSVWEPVLPRFSYKILLSYDISFSPKGILFYELTVPIEETTIPIKNNVHTLFLPSSDHVTYAPDAKVSVVEKDGKSYRAVKWVNRRDMIVEFSKLPLPKMGIKAVNIFWTIVILALLAITFLIHRRLRL